jgi:hypothetical protein
MKIAETIAGLEAVKKATRPVKVNPKAMKLKTRIIYDLNPISTSVVLR